ncbi:MAG: DUF2306 domain-containing protein [Planctomycetota bacterium]
MSPLSGTTAAYMYQSRMDENFVRPDPRSGDAGSNIKLLKFIRWLTFLVLACSGALIISNSRVYFTTPMQALFLMERPALAASDYWRALLAVHVAGGAVCLVSLLIATLTSWNKVPGTLHRWSGRIYAVSVLGLLCPAGLLLTPYAKGGLPGKAAFLLLVILTAGFTAEGVRYALKRNFKLHKRWMTRSMAMVASAMTFRMFQAVLGWSGAAPEPNYVVSLYLSIFVNWLVIESWLGTFASLLRPSSATKSEF